MGKAKAITRDDTLDRLFAGACTAMFLVLMGSVVQAVYLYWR
jgi:hypothetical protein